MFKVAVVGRPNVGKSALFNRICKKRIAIVDEAEGITRDRLYARADFFGTPFELIDTGGIDPRSKADFNQLVKRQAEIAIEEADSLIMVVDSKTGPTLLDEELARILLRTQKPVCLAVNKVDDESHRSRMDDFHCLGISEMIPVSAAQNFHIAELLEAAFSELKEERSEEEEEKGIKIAIIGRPNVGKSSLVNYFMEEERCIVSPIAGTTRDSIDVTFEQKGQIYTLIDTAGIRRKHAEHEVVDKFAAIRTRDAIERSDVCLLMLDSESGMTTQEKRIANQIEEAGKACIILFNKWDLMKGVRMEHCEREVEEQAPFLRYCPKLFMSANSGRNVEKIFPLIREVYDNTHQRIATAELNKYLEAAMQRTHPPMLRGKRLRVYYMAQVGICPPKFVLFVNYPDLMTDSYKRFLYNQFRLSYPFTGVPIRFHLRGKKAEKKGSRTKSQQ